MKRRKIKPGDRINIGVQVDGVLWKKFRLQCFKDDLLSGRVLDDIISNFLEDIEEIEDVEGKEIWDKEYGNKYKYEN